MAWFLFRRESEARRLSEELAAGAWRPRGFDVLLIHDPKPRAIARAPFVDRVVHSALTRLMEPVFLPSAIDSDMACRAGFGTDRAVLLARRFLARHRFALHLDVRAFFPSIDPARVLALVDRRVDDPGFMEVLGRVMGSGTGIVDRPGVREWVGLSPDWPPAGIGLPVGAHTSQFLATHVYLLALDHFIKRDLKVPGYLRFVDDLLLFGDHRADLRNWRASIGQWLWEERRLRLKHPDAPVISCGAHLDALGMRIGRGGVSPLPRAERRFRQRLFVAARDPGPVDDGLRASAVASVFLLLGR